MFQNYKVQNKLNIMVDANNYKEPFYDVEYNTIFLPNNFLYNLELVHFIKQYPFGDLRILSTSLITKDVLLAIRDNQHIFSIYLGSENDPYVLTRDVFDILNQSESLFNIVTNEVIGNFSSAEIEYISYFKNIKVGQYSASDLVSLDSFHFYEPLSETEIEYLKKYLKTGVNIYFEYQSYDNIMNVVRLLKGRNIHFFISYSKYLSDYFEDFKAIMDQKEKISIIESMNLDRYIFLMSIMKLMVKDIVNSKLSPYERYLAVYEIVTHFKEYAENNRHLSEARNLEYILFNNYIVCEGFSKLFVALLELVGISACNIEVIIHKSKEIPTLEQEAQLSRIQLELLKGNVSYHARVLVRLIDSKYNIDGIFIADPTWDNSLENHFFNHSLMTPYEVSLENMNFGETITNILNVSSFQEFLQKIELFPNTLNDFIDIIQKIDFNYYLYLKKKYDLDLYDNDFLLDIYNYIILHSKNRVTEYVRNDALQVLFQFIHNPLNVGFVDDIIKENKDREKYYFRSDGNGR